MERIMTQTQSWFQHQDGEPIENNIRRILHHLGEDVEREGLKETPKRYIKFLQEFLQPKDFKFTSFDAEGTDEMILQTNIPFYSLCEHHIAPFFGVAHVAYIPSDKSRKNNNPNS